jgi:hypothetical protein
MFRNGPRIRGISTLLLISALVLARNVAAQGVVTMGIDDPALLLGYFSLHLEIDRAAVQDPSLRNSAALMMGITGADFAAVSRTALPLLAEIQSIAVEEAAFLRGVSRTGPAQNFASFNARRKIALTSALKTIQSQISPQSWNALHSYINGRYRNSIQSRSIGTK